MKRLPRLVVLAVLGPGLVWGADTGRALDLRAYPDVFLRALGSKDPPRVDAERIDPEDKRVEVAKAIERVEPVFPEGQGAEAGVVVIDCLVTVTGAVDSCVFREGTAGPAFVEAALAAIKKWKYRPARLDGEIRPAYMTVTINFRTR
jgi:TonB family protein